MRHMLEVFAGSYVPGRHVFHTFGTFFGRHTVASGVLAIVLLAGGTTALADRAVPGDILYPVKLSINDRVAVAVAGDADARLNKEMEQIGRILGEEETAADVELQNELETDQGEDQNAQPESRKDILQKYADVKASSGTSARTDIQEDAELNHELRSLSAEIDKALTDNGPESN